MANAGRTSEAWLLESLPTSWFSGQRWLYLDSSWEFLFANSTVSSVY